MQVRYISYVHAYNSENLSTYAFAQKSVANVFPRGVRVGVHVIWALCSDPNLSISSLCRHGVHCCTAGQRGSALMGVAVEFLRLVTRDLPLARWLRTCVRYKRGERGWTSTFRSSLVNRCATSLPFAVFLFLHAGLSFNRDFFNIFIDHLRLIMLFKGEKVSASDHHF